MTILQFIGLWLLLDTILMIATVDGVPSRISAKEWVILSTGLTFMVSFAIFLMFGGF